MSPAKNQQSRKIVDEFTRECLTIEVEQHMTGLAVVATLRFLFELRGLPERLRSGNGPEFIAQVVKDWLAESQAPTGPATSLT
jgi:hypothetical protein